MVKIKVTDACVACAACEDACPADVFEVDEKSVPVNADECIECCSCVEACPEDAIEHESC